MHWSVQNSTLIVTNWPEVAIGSMQLSVAYVYWLSYIITVWEFKQSN